MAKQHSSQISLTFLILCLCLGSLAILAVINVTGTPVFGIFEATSENSSLLDHAEYDNEFVIAIIAGVIYAGLIFSKSRPMSLDFPSLRLSPDSPPPKYS
jgi:hypothetical protein